MKALVIILGAAVFLSVSIVSNAQQLYPAAVSISGILLGKYKILNDAENSLPDTISLSDAKGIFAINAIYIDQEHKLERVDIAEYQITFFERGKNITLKGNSSMLSTEMKEQLNKIHSGDRIIFENIMAKFLNGDTRHLILLDTTVI